MNTRYEGALVLDSFFANKNGQKLLPGFCWICRRYGLIKWQYQPQTKGVNSRSACQLKISALSWKAESYLLAALPVCSKRNYHLDLNLEIHKNNLHASSKESHPFKMFFKIREQSVQNQNQIYTTLGQNNIFLLIKLMSPCARCRHFAAGSVLWAPL